MDRLDFYVNLKLMNGVKEWFRYIRVKNRV